MSVEPGLLDANVLVYAINPDAPEHLAARSLLDTASSASVTLYVNAQVICEFYSVITNQRRVSAAISPSEGLVVITTVLSLPGIHFLPSPAKVATELQRLLRISPVRGAEVFDLQLAATMLANGVRRIYTFNTADFPCIPELIVIKPQNDSAGAS
jgi:hypothetical protein